MNGDGQMNGGGLRVSGLVRRFADGRGERIVLDGVELTVQPGEFVALMGPSGSGKSTVLHLCAGLDSPDGGIVEAAGRVVTGLDARGLADLRREVVGYVEQRWNLLPSLTAAENVALPLELGGTKARDARGQALKALDEVGLTDLADLGVDQLSGGEQQRVAIARALIGGRSVLLADEPTAALDRLTAEAVVTLLRRRADGGVAVLMTTHDAAMAAWADRIVFLRDGGIIDETRPAPLESGLRVQAPIDADDDRGDDIDDRLDGEVV